MRKRFSVFAAFFTSLCAVCAFLLLALTLGSMTGCSPVGHTESPPPLSSVEPSGQPSAEPPPTSPDGPTLAPEPSQDVLTSEAVTPPPAQSTPAPAPTAAQPSEGTPGNKFYAVLTGSKPFYSTDTSQNLTINELGRAVSSDSGVTVKVLKFTCADLDGDGAPEAILWLQVNENDAYGFEVLRRQQNGQIDGYTLPYRSFMDLKTDGTFSFSSGAADSGFGSISFSDKAYTINETTYSQSAYDSNNELTISYFVNGQTASEAEYLAAVEKQNGKESVLWYDFTTENIASSTVALWRNF